jgi:luciferase family oxidoreductase group 1
VALRLSVLDQSPVSQGMGEDVAIRQTIEMARHCEALGYSRFWVSEHHGSQTIVGSAPEILVAALASNTTRIRVGTAGVLLPHYSPLKVAEQFRVLEAIAPGRIDLGLGRAPGTEGRMAHALNPLGDDAVQRFPANVRDIVAWTSDAPLVEGHPFASLRVTPRTPGAPEVWVLGSSDYGAQVAAYLGLPFCFAAFINERGCEAALATHRQLYRPSERWPTPFSTACVFALAAETTDEARRVFATRARSRLNRDLGIRTPLLPPDEALADLGPAERSRVDQIMTESIWGDGETCARKLEALAAKWGIDEIVVLTHTYAVEDRKRSFEVLAKHCGLAA